MSRARWPEPDHDDGPKQKYQAAGGGMTTAIVNLLNKPLNRSRSHERERDNEGSRENHGITLQPWMVSLLAALLVSLLGWATMWGTVMTRLDAQEAMIERLMRITDDDRERERTRGPMNHATPPVGGFGAAPR